MRTLSAIFIMLALSFTAAWNLPSDADIFVTANDGTIVGIGKTVGGASFVLELLVGFEGFARLLIVGPDGDTNAFDVMVSDGNVFLDLVDLTVVVREAGFTDSRVFAADLSARPDDAGRPADVGADGTKAADTAQEGMGNASETGRDHAGDAPSDNAYDGAGNADDGADNAAHPDVPAPPVDVPAKPPAGAGRP